jgi:hypothetical protein
MPFGCHIREKNAHLTVFHLASGSTILQANASRLLPPFGKAGFIDGQDGGLLAQLLKRVGTQVIAHPIGVPDSAGEQALHPIGTCFSRVFSQLPAIFSGRFTQNPLQVSQRPATRLGTGKAGGNTRMQMRKRLDPVTDIGRGRPGSGACGMLILLQLLLLSASALWFSVSHLQSVTSGRRRWGFFYALRALIVKLKSATVVTDRGFVQAIHLHSRQKRGGFPWPETPRVPAYLDT